MIESKKFDYENKKWKGTFLMIKMHGLTMIIGILTCSYTIYMY